MMQVLGSILQQPRDFWKHKLWKENIVPIENTLGHFSRLQNRINLRKQRKWVQTVFDICFASNKSISVGPMRSLETTFQKKIFHPGEKKDFGLFFLKLQTFADIE